MNKNKTVVMNPMCGKQLMQEIEWEGMKCEECGATLPSYPSYISVGEVKTCPVCGRKHLMIRNTLNIRRNR